jgi:tetratricopeptide (TPR) repeat protein
MIYIRNIFILLLLLFSNLLMAQVTTLDSLLNVLSKSKNDSSTVITYLYITTEYQQTDLDKALEYAKKGLALCQTINFKSGKADLSKSVGDIFDMKGEFSLSIEYYEISLTIYTSLKNNNGIAEVKNSLGRIYEKQGNYNKALNNYLNALKLRENLNDKKGIASSMNNIGLIYYYQANYKGAMEYFTKTLKIVEELDNKFGMAMTLNNMGLVYDKQSMYDTATVYFKQSLKLHEQIGNEYGMATSYTNLGNMLYSKKDFSGAEQYYKKSIELKDKLGDKWGLVSTYVSLAVLYQKQVSYNKAILTIEKAKTLSEEIGYREGSRNSYVVLAELYAAIGNFRSAYEAHQYYVAYKDSILNEENSKVISQLQEQYNADKREREIQLLNTQKQKDDLKIKQQATQIYAFIIGSLLLVVLAFVVWTGYRNKKKANDLLASQNEEITRQKTVIEAKNLNILASINYAKRIQEAILPPSKLVKESVEKSFILFKPKDIVSGDFYWMAVKQQIVLFSVVDCTGHGVPGAFMSIVGYNNLNQAVNEQHLVHPGEILDKLNSLVELTLHSGEGGKEVKDGMDIALCAFNTKTNVLEFSGANNPLYLIRSSKKPFALKDEKYCAISENQGFSLYEIKANRQPIGAYIHRESFTNHIIPLIEGDTIYIFSDGFPDQFGGPNGKKFKYKPFKELLLSIQEHDMTTQRTILDKAIEDWKGGLFEQVDDICVIGVRV